MFGSSGSHYNSPGLSLSDPFDERDGAFYDMQHADLSGRACIDRDPFEI